jgi:hypothetical protein
MASRTERDNLPAPPKLAVRWLPFTNDRENDPSLVREKAVRNVEED